MKIDFKLITQILFSLFLGINSAGFILHAEVSQEWIIIPDKICLYEGPDLSKITKIEIPGYPRTVLDLFELESLQPQEEMKWIKVRHGQDFFFLPKAMLVQKVQWSKTDGNLLIGQEKVDRWSPLPYDYKPDDLIKLPQKWNYHPQEYPKYLRSEIVQKLDEMLTAAERKNIHIRVVSAFRSALDQRRLYLRKINQAGLDQILVAKPGHSEHQLGTTVDLCGVDPDYVLKPEFKQTKEGIWLQQNAALFGFIQSYTEKNAEKTGYSPEPWHFRYMGTSDH